MKIKPESILRATLLFCFLALATALAGCLTGCATAPNVPVDTRVQNEAKAITTIVAIAASQAMSAERMSTSSGASVSAPSALPRSEGFTPCM